MGIYYVKSSGGTGAGTSDSTAWSLTKYNSMASGLVAGDQVKFKQGDTFNGPINVQVGSTGNPITYTSYNTGVTGANPIINGLTILTSWTVTGTSNVYSTPFTFSNLQGVYLDGVLRGMGRYPNSGYLTYSAHSGNASISGSSVNTLPTNFIGAELVIKKWRYIIDRHIITNQTSTTLTYSSTNFIGQSDSYNPTDGNGYFIQGHLGCLDTDGDWYHNGTTLYMYFNGSPTTRVVKVNAVDKLVTMNSMGNMTFSGLDFVGGNIGLYCNSITNVTVTNCNFKWQSGRCSIYADGATNFNMLGGSISDNNNTGLLIEQNALNCTIDGVTVNNIGVIPGAGWSGEHAQVGIWTNGNGNTVKNCSLTNIGYVGIGSINSNDWLVEKNKVDTFCVVKDDGGGIYCYVVDNVVAYNRIIRNNIVLNAIGNWDGAGYNSDPIGEAAAIYLDGYSNHTTVTNNICAHGPWMGILNNANSFNNITNNFTYDFIWGFLITQVATSGPGSVRNLTVTGNKFFAKSAPQITIRIDLIGVADNPANMGTFDNNHYVRPVAEGPTMEVRQNYSGGAGLMTMSLATWKSNYGLDTNSLSSQYTTVDESTIRFDYNFSASPVTLSLGAQYKDTENTIYSSSKVLAAFDGDALIYYAPILGSGILVTPAGKILVLSGKILVSP